MQLWKSSDAKPRKMRTNLKKHEANRRYTECFHLLGSAMTRRWLFLVLLVVSRTDFVLNETRADDTLLAHGAGSEQFFEQEVRPILVERCSECHGANKQEGGLRVDSIRSLLESGDSDPRIIPGDINSRLLQTVRREGDLEMPPDTPLSSREVRSLEQWVKSGAFWPATLQKADHSASQLNAGKDHWAFQPIKLPDVPKIENSSWVKTPVDAWIAEKWIAEKRGPDWISEIERRRLERKSFEEKRAAMLKITNDGPNVYTSIPGASELRSVTGMPDQAKNVITLWEEAKFFAKPVIAKLFAVVGSNDDHGVVPHVHFYERIPHSA